MLFKFFYETEKGVKKQEQYFIRALEYLVLHMSGSGFASRIQKYEITERK